MSSHLSRSLVDLAGQRQPLNPWSWRGVVLGYANDLARLFNAETATDQASNLGNSDVVLHATRRIAST